MRLQIQPSLFDRLISWLLQQWFLPPQIVLKRQKINWDEEFDNEKHIYATLAPLQGKVIPICYGEAQCAATGTTGTRALVLSDVGGVCLSEDAAKGFDVAQLEAMLEEFFRALAELKVAHDDFKLDNYRLVGDKIIVIDFDSSYVF
ncbi:hypothetical protein NEMBOFW57_009061 [Staphylotrichum longicolle]|uniref:Protein kinase domain-containing protein n=1 Tax=Staphylotrichum longicolle TaxID=669026 RepID=A0AAD4EW88_9PEZI|nr:hypothetical protein NEMBOFW57_009061 [Staphylotrichum longicolle]